MTNKDKRVLKREPKLNIELNKEQKEAKALYLCVRRD